jgi:Tol biopolymer transport system component
VFVIGADGNGMRKVTPGLAREGEYDASWSPDGSRIVFARSYHCAASLGFCLAIWVIKADGSAEERLTPENVQRANSAVEPTWSPDGHKIAYVLAQDRAQTSDIWVIDADGSKPRRLTHVRDAEEPAWAPDGRKIAFSHDGDIVVRELTKGSLQQLNRTPGLNETDPDWSPDGKRIAYVRVRNDFQEYAAYVMDADGTNTRRLSRASDKSDEHPVWSPGGELIAYSSDAPPLLGDEPEIVIVDADSGQRVRRIPDAYPSDWTAD